MAPRLVTGLSIHPFLMLSFAFLSFHPLVDWPTLGGKKRHWNEEIKEDLTRPALEGKDSGSSVSWSQVWGSACLSRSIPRPLKSLFPRTACDQMGMHNQRTLAGWNPRNANFVHKYLRHSSKERTDWFTQRKWRHFKCSLILVSKSTDTNMYISLSWEASPDILWLFSEFLIFSCSRLWQLQWWRGWLSESGVKNWCPPSPVGTAVLHFFKYNLLS